MRLEGCTSINTAVTVLTVAAIVIGALGVKGVMMNPALGWIAVGIGSGMLFANIAAKARYRDAQSWGNFAFGALVGSAFIAVGVLGGLNILQSNYLGWSMIGIAVASYAIYNCCSKHNRAKPVEIACCLRESSPPHILRLTVEPNCDCSYRSHNKQEQSGSYAVLRAGA